MTDRASSDAVTNLSARRRTDWLTVEAFCGELQISRSTWNDWRAKGRGPRCVRLPNGSLRIRRADFDKWLNTLEADAA
ncbi:helix-turn-helix domain-containing protein [Saccharopolyspora sp. NFXS83]|uniref:helix-turn-helix transcriptional regulator n=1 Tax=Saccharopolyspora sp. NFXS83 TaxID=2993560 RepID=UPI00224B0C4C|nr:helix-turn-helix domain-containing protein [Saccharopolyspora sp. NFXS83]MCX2728934.1 helix-turn-helix domain-containing protein [Saccharopolyspora sp. NFXS83]